MTNLTSAFLLVFVFFASACAVENENVMEIEILKERIGKVEQSLKNVLEFIAKETGENHGKRLKAMETNVKKIAYFTAEIMRHHWSCFHNSTNKTKIRGHSFHHHYFHGHSSSSNSSVGGNKTHYYGYHPELNYTSNFHHRHHGHRHGFHDYSTAFNPYTPEKIIEYGKKYLLAQCDMAPNPNQPQIGGGVRGRVYFREEKAAQNKTLEMRFVLRGFPGTHGHGHGHALHIHEFGDLSNGCESTGKHFNPTNTKHGLKDDSVRHVGDFGNIAHDARGEVFLTLTDKVATLAGENTIIGRSLVVHHHQEERSKHEHGEPKKGKNHGIACCVIKKKNISAKSLMKFNY